MPKREEIRPKIKKTKVASIEVDAVAYQIGLVLSCLEL